MRSIAVSLAAALVTLGSAATPLGATRAPTSGDGLAPGPPGQNAGRVVRLLEEGQVVFGIFSGDKTPEQGARIVETGADFVFYSLERGPFDLPTLEAYMRGMVGATGDDDLDDHPVLLRIPPLRDDPEAAFDRTRQALQVGVHGIVFPHVENAEQAARAVGAVGANVSWPSNPAGDVVNMVLIEDRVGIENAREIVGTPGISIVAPGPGDLRRAYEGDAEAIEDAIQTVLAACLELDVPCAITAGADDIAERVEQGFRVFIVSQPEAIEVGKRAAGRLP